eukprot:gnl/TRDRNA2_/TRDRNA2_166892_c0_seq1.p1 gnl/TRDRNA2_/TRDRNA2_166892_c0~~gnl/TRDRNA2_/TRDRNA2_166892_c0_seq1.p1  ORF type:complete len:220 (-),score=16.94 gnl/TRDRNA2_/TRDRNA2_166892_c0_seq1:126-713(-)
MSMILGSAGIGACVATNLFVWASRPAIVLFMSILRGFIGGVFGSLLPSGLVFIELGVSRNELGRVLGLNSRLVLFGTGTGPLLYGVSRDILDGFRWSLHVTAMPPLVVGVVLIFKGWRAWRAGAPPTDSSLAPKGSGRCLNGYVPAAVHAPADDIDTEADASPKGTPIGKSEHRHAEERENLGLLVAPDGVKLQG